MRRTVRSRLGCRSTVSAAAVLAGCCKENVLFLSGARLSGHVAPEVTRGAAQEQQRAADGDVKTDEEGAARARRALKQNWTLVSRQLRRDGELQLLWGRTTEPRASRPPSEPKGFLR